MTTDDTQVIKMSDQETTDRELIERVIAGIPGASDTLVDKFSNFVWSILRRDLSMPPEDTEDLHSEIFMRLLDDGCRRLRRWSGEGNFVNYLGPIVRNMANDYFRRKKVRKEVSLDQQDDDDDRLPVDPVCTDPSPEEEAEAAEQRQLLYKAMEDLSERDQAILSRRHFDERSYKQLADEFDYTIGSVGAILARAEKRLKKAVDRLLESRLAPTDL